MSGGDFLFIFSFIVLPTAILVSAIWALIALRAGVLLPPRPTMDLDEQYGASDEPVDERVSTDQRRPEVTHAAVASAPRPIEPTVPLAVSTDRDTQVNVPQTGFVTDPAVSTSVTPPEVGHDAIETPAEQTLEMDAWESTTRDAPPIDAVSDVAALPQANGNGAETMPALTAAPTPAPTVPSSPVRPLSASVPDDLDVVFVPGNRTVAPMNAPVSHRERPDGTQPLAAERSAHDAHDAAVVADDLDTITPDEARSESTLPTGPAAPARSERDGGQRRGGRGMARRRQAEEQGPRQRILVAPPSRRGNTGNSNRAHRSDESASVAQDERLMQRGDGA